MLGVSDKTVGAVRKEMERRAEIPHVDVVTDTLGRKQPRKRKKQSAIYSKDTKEVQKAVDRLSYFRNDRLR